MAKNERMIGKSIEQLLGRMRDVTRPSYIPPDTNHRPTVCIEAAHFYTSYTPEDIQVKCLEGARIGGWYAQAFKSGGFTVDTMLFVDDYNPQFEDKPVGIVTVKQYLEQLEKVGFVPEKVVYESSLAQRAQEILEQLKKEGKCYEAKGEWTLSSNIELKKGEHLSCALLDAVLTERKLQEADLVVNVLPAFWKSQQKNMTKVAKAIGLDTGRICSSYYKEGIQHQEREMTNAEAAMAYMGIADQIVGVKKVIGYGT